MSADDREKRRASVGKAASEKVAKSEQLNFRLEENSIKDLQKLSKKKGMPVGTMIREWVLERLAREKLGDQNTEEKALLILDETYAKLKTLFEQPAPKLGIISYHDSKDQTHPKSAVRETKE